MQFLLDNFRPGIFLLTTIFTIVLQTSPTAALRSLPAGQSTRQGRPSQLPVLYLPPVHPPPQPGTSMMSRQVPTYSCQSIYTQEQLLYSTYTPVISVHYSITFSSTAIPVFYCIHCTVYSTCFIFFSVLGICITSVLYIPKSQLPELLHNCCHKYQLSANFVVQCAFISTS